MNKLLTPEQRIRVAIDIRTKLLIHNKTHIDNKYKASAYFLMLFHHFRNKHLLVFQNKPSQLFIQRSQYACKNLINIPLLLRNTMLFILSNKKFEQFPNRHKLANSL